MVMTIVRYSLDGVPSNNTGIYGQLKACWTAVGMTQPPGTSGRQKTVCFHAVNITPGQIANASTNFWNLITGAMPPGASLDHFWMYTDD